MREHAKKWGIDEPEYGVFTMDGEHAMCSIGMFVVDITKRNHACISYLNTWLFDVCGDVEDCIASTKEWYKEKNIQLLDIMTTI